MLLTTSSLRRLATLLVIHATLGAVPTQADNALPTTVATAGEWRPMQAAYAQVSAQRQAVLKLPFAARIRSLAVEPGARVGPGDTLATFDAPQLRRHLAAWQLARHGSELAQQQLKVLRQNRRENTITRGELLAGEQTAAKAVAEAELAWQTLAADLDLLNLAMDAEDLAQRVDAHGLSRVARELGRLQAPFAGMVIARRATLGEQLAAGDPILELESLKRVYLDVEVAESALPNWQHGQTYWPGTSGKIALQPLGGVPRLDPDSGLWLLRFTADNPGYRLHDGAWVEVQHLGEPLPVAWLPAAAVVSRNGRHWVMVSSAGSFKPVEVQTGAAGSDGRIPVTKGIGPGTTVVTEGAYELLYRDLKDLIKFVD